jgi:hypothetical protein
MTDQEIESHKKSIDSMDQISMACLWRRAPSGHPYFDSSTPLAQHFSDRFKSLGGFTSAISKAIGW